MRYYKSLLVINHDGAVSMKLANASKLITGILPKGKAMPVLKQLKAEFNIIAGNINHARGSGRITPLAYRGIGEQTEKEILNVVVDEVQAEAIFEFIFFTAEINQPHGGLLFQTTLSGSTRYQLPDDVPDER